MPITTTTLLPPPVHQSYALKLLIVPTASMIHNLAAMKRKMPANGGSVFRQARFNQIPAAMVPLGNTGVTPPADVLTSVNIDAQINFYGTYVEINEQVVLQSQCPVLNEAAARLGVSLRLTEDQLSRDMMQASAAFINCVGGINGRIVAVVKSFLIDLELLPGNAGDNRAQASLGWVA